MDALFAFLFKYRPVLFQEGDLVLGTPWPVGLLVGIVAVVGAAAVATYGAASGKASPAERTVPVQTRPGR